MVQSINTKVDLTIDATSYLGVADYGKIMIGDKGFEFFNNRDARKFVQIPWEEVDSLLLLLFLRENGFHVTRYKRKRMALILLHQRNPKKC